MTTLPIRYDDPRYAALARMAEGKYGLPSGLLDAIRTLGERSNANQVSPAGARTPYQVIPATRQGIMRNYGIDPWSSAEAATEGAAALLAENMKRAGNVKDAVAMYHGGLNRRNWGPRTQNYVARVSEGLEMPQTPTPRTYERYYSNAPDPLAPLPDPNLAPEPPTQPVPIPGDPGMSASAPAASKVASKKRGGILGALESVFMPDPDTLWAAALRGGVWDAKSNREQYRQQAQANDINTQMAQAKLKNLLTKGEYQIAGNNVVHFPADGGEPVLISPPATQGEKERLIDAWRREADPQVKDLMERLLLGGNSDPALQSKERAAGIRAGATVQSARIRSAATGSKKSSTAAKPPAGFILDE